MKTPRSPIRDRIAPLPAALLLLLTLALLASPAALPLGAQEPDGEEAGDDVYRPSDEALDDSEAPPPEELEVFVDTVDVQVVNVDVYVTDKKGNRVTGLGRDDFEVKEDGRPVKITNFYAVEDGREVTDAADGEATEQAEEAAEASQEDVAEASRPAPAPLRHEEADVPDEQRLFLVVYIDNFNLHPANRNRVMGELSYFLTTELDPGDQIMLVTYDRSLNVRRPFTADPDLISRALREVERLTAHAVSRDDEQRSAMDRIFDERTSAASAMAYARMYAESMANDLAFTVGALKELVNQLGGLPGRKAILYVSDGVPMVPGQEAFHAVQSRFGASTGITQSLEYDASRDFTRLANAANANRVTFYTIDAAGLRLQSSFAAENANPSVGVQVDSVTNSNLQSPLRYVAETTGGLAVLNTNRILPRMEAVAEDFDSYYSLGYRPPAFGSGRYHEIDVRVKGRKDLEVRHRRGYRDKTIEARMNDGTVSALNFGFRDNPLGVDVAFSEARPRDAGHYLVDVQVDLPMSELVFVPRADTHEARVRLYVAAKDEGGDQSPVRQVSVPISIPSEEMERARQQRYRYSVSLLMRRGVHSVAVGVRDVIANKESFVVEDLRVGPSPRGRG